MSSNHDPQNNAAGADRPSPAEAQAKIDEMMEEARASRFDWCGDEDIVVPSQPATAVYLNGEGAVVIRQEGPVYEDDPFVFIRPEYAQALCDAILRTAGIRKPLALPAPERPRRRNGHSEAGQQQRSRLDEHPDLLNLEARDGPR